ncbi:MAG: c-type cytochrome [bacterium]
MKPAVIVFGFVGVLVLALGIVGAALLTGAFDFSATTTPNALEERLSRFVLNRSIERRAPRTTNPLPSSREVMEEGLSHYRTNCLQCHGAPGVEPFELAKGLNPPPPDLSAPAVQSRSDGELFWIVSHGIKMTGMPGFGPTHSDKEIWAIVGMVRHLPQLTDAERVSLERAHEAQEHRHEGETTHDSAESHADGPEMSADHETQSHRDETGPSEAVTEHHAHAPQTPAVSSAKQLSGEAAHDTHTAEPASPDPEHKTHAAETPATAPAMDHAADSTRHAPDSMGRVHGEHTGPATGDEHGTASHEQPVRDHTDPMQGHAEHGGQGMGSMTGLYGSYPMSREASGTAWQPDLASHAGVHITRGQWIMMVHGFATAVYDHQGGARGDDDVFSASMLMGMARRPLGKGTLGLRAMLSADPLTIGKEGYPLLLQTGETADGKEPLIDRQHPHDLFMELAASFSVASADRSAFLYLGMPGEPALGPPAFMHRFSGAATPLAPISHHWLDSTHITYGVATLGFVAGPAKLEGSLFTGREPDENRAGWDSPEMDSHALRASYNPTNRWSLQTSFGRLESPEQLHAEQNTDRTTASIMYNSPRASGETQITAAWGRNRNRPGQTTDMFLVEATTSLGARSTFFARAEHGEKNELFEDGDPRAERIFNVSQFSGGYLHEILTGSRLSLGLGGSAGVSFVPDELKSVYGDMPFSGTVFVRGLLE